MDKTVGIMLEGFFVEVLVVRTQQVCCHSWGRIAIHDPKPSSFRLSKQELQSIVIVMLAVG